MIKVPSNRNKSSEDYSLRVEWNIPYFTDTNIRLKRTLKHVSQYSLDIMNKEYVPKQSGNLIDSSVIEEYDNRVHIKWEAPYAKDIYYDKSKKLDSKRGHSWFDRMIDDYRTELEREMNMFYKRS